MLQWIANGEVDGVRIDHPDGLRDPTGYFERLAAVRKDLWIVAEKILEPGEKLPEDWAVSGTTGYDFLNEVGGLFVRLLPYDMWTIVFWRGLFGTLFIGAFVLWRFRAKTGATTCSFTAT